MEAQNITIPVEVEVTIKGGAVQNPVEDHLQSAKAKLRNEYDYYLKTVHENFLTQFLSNLKPWEEVVSVTQSADRYRQLVVLRSPRHWPAPKKN